MTRSYVEGLVSAGYLEQYGEHYKTTHVGKLYLNQLQNITPIFSSNCEKVLKGDGY
jgi:predicted transcriptional regulator